MKIGPPTSIATHLGCSLCSLNPDGRGVARSLNYLSNRITESSLRCPEHEGLAVRAKTTKYELGRRRPGAIGG